MSKLPFLKTISQKDGPCLECWLINICGGCVLRWFYDFKDKYFSSLPQPNLCKASREYAKNIILNLARLQSDSIKFDIFVKRIANEMSL